MSNYISWLQQEMEIRQLNPNDMTQQAMEEIVFPGCHSTNDLGIDWESIYSDWEQKTPQQQTEVLASDFKRLIRHRDQQSVNSESWEQLNTQAEQLISQVPNGYLWLFNQLINGGRNES